MDDFAWLPLTPSPHFVSPRFTEFYPNPKSVGDGESPLIETDPFDRAVLSWNGEGNWRLEVRLRVDGVLTPYFVLGELEGIRQSSASQPAEENGIVTVDLDTLKLAEGKTADAFQIRATGSGDLRMLSVAHYRHDDRVYTDRPALPAAWGLTLEVPPRAQKDVEEESEIGGRVCSPTSVSMALEYHGSTHRTIDVCRAVIDDQSKVYGNWPCNTAAAARLLPGAWSAVVKMAGFDELEREIVAGRPVVLSHRWEKEDLSNAPIPRSSGHLILVVGFTSEGDVVVNDPAAKAAEVRRVYRRQELFHTWQELSQGIVYLVHPE
ncbi:MAG: C39 family peptidase [Armatimonadota bacterium]